MPNELGNDTARWAAVLSRDPAADGSFFYGVSSTRVYCRPTCPARRPKRDRVTFFDTPEQAERAGFRPCLRCRPRDDRPRAALEEAVAHARRLLDTAGPAPTLAQLGEAVGLSPHHLQRLFKRATGVSPREYAATRRVERLKEELRRGLNVTQALYEAGYGSARALYDQASAHLGMSPGAYKRGGLGITIRYVFAATPVGPVMLAATAKGICALRFGERNQLLAELRSEFPRATLLEDGRDQGQDQGQAREEGRGPGDYVRAVVAHLLGQNRHLDLPLDPPATPFQEKVWGALSAIPYGETRSYGEVAEMIGRPKAARAVAQALAANPVALAVPCHRVVRASGQPGGYRWGVALKRELLRREAEAVRQGPASERRAGESPHPVAPGGNDDDSTVEKRGQDAGLLGDHSPNQGAAEIGGGQQRGHHRVDSTPARNR